MTARTAALLRILARARRFRRCRRGAMSIEAMFVLPMLVWVYLAMFVFFDAYRTQNVALRAANTVADLLSRETNAVNAGYIDGVNTVFDFLANARHDTRIRVTSVGWNAQQSRYIVNWSHGTRGWQAWTANTFNAAFEPASNANGPAGERRLPLVAAGDSIVLVETRLDYEPAFNIGITARTFEHIIPTRPRFAPQLVWSTAP